MGLGQGQERPPAAHADLEAGSGERLDETIACEARRAGLQHERQPAAHDVRRRGVEERIDELPRGARAKRGQGLDDLLEDLLVREKRNERADEQRVGGGRTQHLQDA